MKKTLILIFSAVFIAACSPKDGHYTFRICTTNDVHGRYFDSLYVGNSVANSLFAVSRVTDSLRKAVGAENVILIDAGDCVQGDNASYYFNYEDTISTHVFARMADYMGYDAIIVGNHDIETGHPVYDKVYAELAERDIPWLGGNAVRTDDGEPYFPVYAMFDRAGLSVAVLGFTNANMKAWLGEELWEGMDFLSLIPYVQDCVDEVLEKENPDVTIVVVHSGTGEGDGSMLESQGLDLLESLEGVDLLVTSHDHRPAVVRSEDGETMLLNGGSHARRVGHAVIDVDKRGGKPVFREVDAEVVSLNWKNSDRAMQQAFDKEFQAVKEFTNRTIGSLTVELRSRDAYAGMSDYINLVHTVQLSVPEAEISFAAPLSFDGTVEPGTVIYNDVFTIYPYENELYVMKLKGSEIKSYLEYSYDGWIQTPGDHVLRIVDSPDPRTGASNWSFAGRSYNFDSAAGLVYTVDVTKPYGQRVEILSLADGSEFDPSQWYNVAMTSYRASGGGDLIFKGAGVSRDELESRTVARYPAIRDMVSDFISSHGTIDSAVVSDPEILGEWHFVPEGTADRMISADLELIF